MHRNAVQLHIGQNARVQNILLFIKILSGFDRGLVRIRRIRRVEYLKLDNARAGILPTVGGGFLGAFGHIQPNIPRRHRRFQGNVGHRLVIIRDAVHLRPLVRSGGTHRNRKRHGIGGSVAAGSAVMMDHKPVEGGRLFQVDLHPLGIAHRADPSLVALGIVAAHRPRRRKLRVLAAGGDLFALRQRHRRCGSLLLRLNNHAADRFGAVVIAPKVAFGYIKILGYLVAAGRHAHIAVAEQRRMRHPVGNQPFVGRLRPFRCITGQHLLLAAPHSI